VIWPAEFLLLCHNVNGKLVDGDTTTIGYDNPSSPLSAEGISRGA
jgi:hypothetical protein